MSANEVDDHDSMDSSVRGTRHPEMTSQFAEAMQITNDDTPMVLSHMKNLKDDAKTSEMVKVINAMRQHILHLEARLKDVDGMRVTERKRKSSYLSLADATKDK